jgi:hypothetical protein
VYEVVAVLLAGAAGGLISTFLRAGMEFPSPSAIDELLEGHRGWTLVYHLIRNSAFGGIASGVLWGLSNSNPSLASQTIAPHQLAAFVIGGAGLKIIDKFFREANEDKALENLKAAMLQVQQTVEREAAEGNIEIVEDEDAGQSQGS